MNEEVKKIIEMMQEGKISKEEAFSLIDAMGEKEEIKINPQGARKFFRIKVIEEGTPKVNITLPFSLVNWGLSLASKLGKNTITVDGKEVPIDLNEIKEALTDPNFSGKIIDVQDEEENTHVEISID